jgi:hypothetical protein
MRTGQQETEYYLPISVAAEMLACHFREAYALAEKGILGFILMPSCTKKISEESVLRQVMRRAD